MSNVFNWKKALSFIIAIVLVAALVGCGAAKTDEKKGETTSKETVQKGADADKSNETQQPKKKYKIALHNYAENFQSSILIMNGVKKAAEKAGIEIVTADINADATKVAQNIDNFILQGVDGIIDASWFAEPGKLTAEKCKAENIPLVTCDVPFDESYSYLVGADNTQAGIVAGKYMAGVVKEKWGGNIDFLVLCYYEAGGPVVRQRMDGAIDGLKQEEIDLSENKIIRLDNQGQTLNTKALVTDFLTAHPDAKHILVGCNNDDGGLGALSAVETANRSKDCFIYSYGAEPTAVDNFKAKDNVWLASVNFSLDKYGDIAVPTIIKLIEGAKDVPRTQSPELSMVDRSNVKQLFP